MAKPLFSSAFTIIPQSVASPFAGKCFFHENFHEVHTANTEIYEVKNKLEKKIENFLSTEIEWVPLNTVNLSGENKYNMIKFLETLDDDEDVQNIFTNAKFEN